MTREEDEQMGRVRRVFGRHFDLLFMKLSEGFVVIWGEDCRDIQSLSTSPQQLEFASSNGIDLRVMDGLCPEAAKLVLTDVAALSELVARHRRGLSLSVRKSQSAGQSVEARHVPRVAKFVLLMVPLRSRDHLIGCLEEEYRTIILPEYGRFWARVWYWEQVAIAVGCYAWPFLKRVLGMAAIWKVIGR